MRLLLAVLLVFTITGVAWGHDVWFIPKGNLFLIAYGHGNDLEKYDVKKVKEVKGFSPKGEPLGVKLIEGDGEVAVSLTDSSKNLAILTVFFDNGYWVKTPEGWKNMSKVEYGKPVEDSSHPLKYSKLILSWSEASLKPVGLEFEIIPLNQPIKDKELGLQVLYKGKPTPDVTIEIQGSDKTFKTDKNGTVIITGIREGYNVIIASTRIPLEDKTHADRLSLSSTLCFELK
ncbi:MAG: DUF4198 domain-containing protein [Synergistetes bacterium]|nr:DUF4198 domain-containing protein [Synergistota bacterium]MCX8128291.1 DUF4198 domain-containing protein [Synergistota bacterium]MDW8192605.1 DUF4198 domain-containing protein [Synergistota bacterium]